MTSFIAPTARAARPASSRPFPQPRPSRQSPSSWTSRWLVRSCLLRTADRDHQRASSSPSELSTPTNLSRQPHMPAILSDLGRGGDVERLAQYLARRRTMNMGLDDRPERAAERPRRSSRRTRAVAADGCFRQRSRGALRWDCWIPCKGAAPLLESVECPPACKRPTAWDHSWVRFRSAFSGQQGANWS